MLALLARRQRTSASVTLHMRWLRTIRVSPCVLRPSSNYTSSSDHETPPANEVNLNYNRWLQVPVATAVSGVCGSNYAWSTFNAPLSRELGVVASSAADWPLTSVIPMFSVATVGLGLGAAAFGPWVQRVGPRRATLVGAAAWGSGLALGAAGVAAHSLPLTYVGYGVLGGIGIGIGYVVPIGVLMRWFPDRRGLAAGLGVLGFGGGAALAAPLNEILMHNYRVPPKFIGSVEETCVSLCEGRRVVEGIDGSIQEVVVATAVDLDISGWGDSLTEGVYIVGSGDTGVAATFGTLAIIYASTMVAGALCFQLPAPGWAPPAIQTMASAGETKNSACTSLPSVSVEDVHKFPQFWLLLGATAGNAIGGTIILSSAKLMISETLGTTMPHTVDAAFCAAFVSGLSIANMSGRVGWAAISDQIGRKSTMITFGVLGVPACLAVPQWIELAAADPGSLIPLAGFCGSTGLLLTMYGGLYALLPAFAADLFGEKHVTAIFGRLMMAAPIAAVAGPMLLSNMRAHSYSCAAIQLANNVDAQHFESKFGAPTQELNTLLANRVVTIPQLLEIAPPGTVDPTPFLYNSTMSTAAVIISAATLCAGCIRPIKIKPTAQARV